MATVECFSGERVKTADRSGKFLYGHGHWARQQDDNTQHQLVHITGRIIGSLKLNDVPENNASTDGGRHPCWV